MLQCHISSRKRLYHSYRNAPPTAVKEERGLSNFRNNRTQTDEFKNRVIRKIIRP
jgi:hypothetical protein